MKVRGVYLVKSGMGYTVEVDGVVIPGDYSWTAADRLAKYIARLRPPGDGCGYARCRHPGNEECFRARACQR